MTTIERAHSATDTTTILGLVGVVGIACFAAAFAAMHAIQPDLSPIEYFGSDYAYGRGGWVMRLGILTAAAGTVALAFGLRQSLAPVKRRDLGVTLLMVAGAGFVGSGLFVTDPPKEDGTTGYTTEGALHDLAGIVLLLSLIAGAFVLSRVFTRDPRWQRWARPTRLFAWIVVVGVVVEVVAGGISPPGTGGVAGLIQRVLFAIVLTWLALLSWHVHRLGASPTRP